MTSNSENRLVRGAVVIYNATEHFGYIRPDGKNDGSNLVYFDRKSLRDIRTHLRETARVIFKTEYRSDTLTARDLYLEPSVTEELAKLPEVVTGKVAFVNSEKGFGFVQVSPRVRAYFNFKSLAHPNLPPIEGDRISCDIIQIPDGRLEAQNVLILEPEEIQLPAEVTSQQTGSSSPSVAHQPLSSQPLPETGQPRSGLEFLRLAQQADRDGDAGKARNLYERGLQEAPTAFLILSFAAWHRRRGEANEAMRVFEEGITKITPSANVFANAGALAMSLKQYDRAIAFLESALQFSENNKQALIDLGKAYFLTGTPESLEKSLIYYEKTIQAYGGINEFARNANPGGPLEAHYQTYVALCNQLKPKLLPNLVATHTIAGQTRLDPEESKEILTDKTNIGKIVSFGSAGFGFIDTADGRTLFFGLPETADENLRQLLQQPDRALNLPVVFNVVAALGRKYDRAVDVRSQQSAQAWVQQAEEMRAANRLRDALPLLDLALLLEPQNQAAQLLREKIFKQIATVEVLPRGNGSYALAKRAETLEKDNAKAERLYRLAIEENDKRESAIKDLAWLLCRQHKNQEAIDLLKPNRAKVFNKIAFDNVLATVYEYDDQFDQVIAILSPLAKHDRKNKPRILKRLAYAYLQLQQLTQAEQALREVLQISPADAGAQRMLFTVQQAQDSKASGQTEDVLETLGSEEDFASPLSPLVEAIVKSILEQGQFKGVDASKLESGNLTINDAIAVADVAKKFGTDKPQDRADYYLSAAVILKKADVDDYDQRFRKYLQMSFASMGDAISLARKNLEIARTFYAESIGLLYVESSEPNPLQSTRWYALISFIRSFGSIDTQKKLPENRSWSILESILHDANRRGANSEEIWASLFRLAARNPISSRMIWITIKNSNVLKAALSNYLEIQKSDISIGLEKTFIEHKNHIASTLSRIESRFAAFRKGNLTVARMDALIQTLNEVNQSILCELERQRLGSVKQIAVDALTFCRATDFDEAQNYYYIVQTNVEKFTKGIEDAPTAISFESFLPLVKHLNSLVEESYLDRARTSLPEVSLKLVSEVYVTAHGNEITLQILVSNRVGSSRATNLELDIAPTPSPFFSLSEKSLRVADSIRAGDSVVKHVALYITEGALQQKAFPITIRCRYQTPLGPKAETNETPFTVRLYDETEFKEIRPNPYTPYSEGGPVRDEKMFFGRKELIIDIQEALLASGGTKCFLVYGQKRAGKSTFLEHLKRRLEQSNCLPVMFSVYDNVTNLSETTFLHMILTSIRDALWNKFPGLEVANTFQPPSISAFREYPSIQFHESMSQLHRLLKTHPDLEHLRIVLLIDEFSEIYTRIKEGHMPRQIMKLWKAIIEKQYFSCVLIGKDIMPAFKAEFPNEFGVTTDRRLNYLDDREARELIENPIGAERYRGNAIARILELTAGSPYYTMIVCDRLVSYINATRSLIVTEADIEKVKDVLISGKSPLTKEQNFDPLYKPGEGSIETGIDPEITFKLCAEIAQNAKNGWTQKTDIPILVEAQERILEDLCARDVMERRQDNYRLRVGLFYEWLLVHG
jgi:tetratricopeptide (TPR) repeat protein/cold shock CspA family protein